MKKLVAIVAAAAAMALLAVLALSSPGLAADPINVTLNDLASSGITGDATLTPNDDGSQTDVQMNAAGLDAKTSHINHIHDGTGCGDGEYAGVVVTLTDLSADPQGDASELSMVTQTDGGDPISFAEIADGTHVLIIHDIAGAPAACGVIPQMAPEPTPTGAPAPTATVSALAQTGIDGLNDGNRSNLGLVALVVGLAAAFGLASLGLGVAARRVLR